ncbi:MAG: sterol desaturase family protein [Pseudomonadales bacterium]|nr:sterol desaturase family protein [Pseudomonadales bacterium]
MTFLEFVTQHETSIRMGCFVGTFLLVALWEDAAPRRPLAISKMMRWVNNLSLALLSSVVLRLVFPAAAVGVAAFAQTRGWGLLHPFSLPFWLTLVVSIVVMDFVIYLQHRLFHVVPLLWRLHSVHHADLDYDVTTGSRFHPFEILLSMMIKMAAIAALGPPVVAVVFFEVLLNGTAMFNHGNLRIPLNIDRFLRWIMVTPDMHRVHHSIDTTEMNRNFGFNFPCWDRLLGTYQDQPTVTHEAMTLGIPHHSDPKIAVYLIGLLLLPFKNRLVNENTNETNGRTIE